MSTSSSRPPHVLSLMAKAVLVHVAYGCIGVSHLGYFAKITAGVPLIDLAHGTLGVILGRCEYNSPYNVWESAA